MLFRSVAAGRARVSYEKVVILWIGVGCGGGRGRRLSRVVVILPNLLKVIYQEIEYFSISKLSIYIIRFQETGHFNILHSVKCVRHLQN